jgi:hypothetical protein
MACAATPTVDADVTAALFRPTAAFADARRAHHAEFQVDGKLRTVEVPLRAEIPASDRERLDRWTSDVARAIRYAPDGARTPVADALARGTGDCTERADALTERANSEGVPARTVRGWAYQDGALGTGLYPHAWTEVRLAGHWIPVDPTFGEVPADATHLVDPSEGTPLSASVALVEIR